MFINIHGGYFEDAEVSLKQLLSNAHPGMDTEYMALVTEMFLAAGRKDQLKFDSYHLQVADMGNYPFSMACALALYGDHDRSFEWLE